MVRKKQLIFSIFVFVCFLILNLRAEEVVFTRKTVNSTQFLTLHNNRIQCTVEINDGIISSETIELINDPDVSFNSSGDFTLDFMWTGWRAPGKISNADNMVQFSKKSFLIKDIITEQIKEGGGKLIVRLKGKQIPFDADVLYQLQPDDFYIKRKIVLRDTTQSAHFLRWIWPLKSELYTEVDIIKSGGFGQPVALTVGQGGIFMGCEYPIAENYCKKGKEQTVYIGCGYEFGEKITEKWIESEWVVFGLTPDTRVKFWFTHYLNDIRIAELKPYLLYNSWYDVRSEIYTQRPEDIMNEKNLLRIINDVKREMTEERNLQLDAFVLDDAWDVYESDWQLRKEEFPRGLKPIADELEETGTDLGIWFGPTGGYSYRSKRLKWMDEHGYETVGREGDYNRKMLCLAGEKYKALFKKRVVDFINQYEVGYYKWDGIQFSCSETDHGHPIGVYSRRAVMESVIDLSTAAREANPDIFINVTSGTWLSPWWLKYANTIWMQGRDYGYAEVPSISKRDAAMTYRDVVLHTNLKVNNLWFPISNLMTHGIIKGHLQKLGGEAEPLDKFTNNALLYFARGVSMWELYISPNLLTEREWQALAQSIRWARDRFDILMHTEMVGGSPTKGEAYGYVHFTEDRGIVALRNPSMENQNIIITLDHDLGFSPNAQSVVIERVYPDRYISSLLYDSGDRVELSLQGYETAVYEIYPLSEAEYPLLAGAVFSVKEITDSLVNYTVYTADENVCLLNPDMVKKQLTAVKPQYLPECGETLSLIKKHHNIVLDFTVSSAVRTATLAFLFVQDYSPESDEHKKDFQVNITVDGNNVDPLVQSQQNWKWIKVPVLSGSHKTNIDILTDDQEWQGKVQAWLLGEFAPESQSVMLSLKKPLGKIRPFPPTADEQGIIKNNVKLAEIEIN